MNCSIAHPNELQDHSPLPRFVCHPPSRAQRQTRAAYHLFKHNPRHGSLQFKRISPSDPTLYSARVGAHYRAIGVLEGDTVTWNWIGTHEAYNTLIGRK